jgi:hypothetical protein
VKLRKTLILRREDSMPLRVDTIEHRGKWWIVPEWLAGQTKGTARPARIICLDGLSLGKPLPQFQVDWVLETPLSRDILEGRVKSEHPRVIEQPDIVVRLDTLRR